MATAGIKNGLERIIGAVQNDIIQCIKEQALMEPMDRDDDDVAMACLDTVTQRWCTDDPNGLSTLKAMVNKLVHAVRKSCRLGRDDVDIGTRFWLLISQFSDLEFRLIQSNSSAHH